MIKIICLGKIKEPYLNDFINDYLFRVNKFHKTEIIELKDENNLETEKDNILKYINSKEFIITLDRQGKRIDSIELSELIDKTFISYSTITFVIGSSEGLHSSIIEKSNLSISFSDFTFPHGLFRGILLEQLYRSFKILNNETYHK